MDARKYSFTHSRTHNMKISRSLFRDQLAGSVPRQRIMFLGMSGIGKTHWSRRLAQAFDYPRVELDDLIGDSPEFHQLIADCPGKDKVEKLGHYFGMPWDDGFAEREKALLQVERRLMQSDLPKDILLDLGGSVIYAPDAMTELAKTGLVIYLQAGREQEQRMLRRFLARPKPVCWGGMFDEQTGESHEDALRRCYPELLHARAAEYERYADVTLPYLEHKDVEDAAAFVELIARHLDDE